MTGLQISGALGGATAGLERAKGPPLLNAPKIGILGIILGKCGESFVLKIVGYNPAQRQSFPVVKGPATQFEGPILDQISRGVSVFLRVAEAGGQG